MIFIDFLLNNVIQYSVCVGCLGYHVQTEHFLITSDVINEATWSPQCSLAWLYCIAIGGRSTLYEHV